MLLNILIGIVVVVAIIVGGAFLTPRHVHLERSVRVNAKRDDIFACVNGFARFNEWSPWFKMEPEADYTFSGPETGVGAKMAWVGQKVGSGSQEITAVDEPSRITLALDFGPRGTAVAYYDLQEDGEGTNVTWGFDTDMGMNPVQRYFGLFMERMLGPQYEQGLTDLKALVESS